MRLTRFRVTSYRNIQDSGWINLSDVTAFVGQNEAGKSNLFEALYRVNPFQEAGGYDPDEDWPVDDWPGRAEADGKLVCQAEFALEAEEIAEFYAFARPREVAAVYDDGDRESGEGPDQVAARADPAPPDGLIVGAYRHYGHRTGFYVLGGDEGDIDPNALAAWAATQVPKFVYIHDYELSGAPVDLNDLRARWDKVGRANRHALSSDDQAVLVILDLARIDLDDLLEKGDSADGRTIRSLDKRAASAFLTEQFQRLWTQKPVRFDIEIDGPTLNIFAEDAEVGMPVRLQRRSSGFRWYVSFAWKFTHASAGAYRNCVLLLEEPGIHLHADGQKDLLGVFQALSAQNTILYTTHLPAMIDLTAPEGVRIVESNDHHATVTDGLVSKQSAPMAVIEASLGLTPEMTAVLAGRHVLIVETGTDALLLDRLSVLLRNGGGEGLSERIALWPAETAAQTPMYAAFALGHDWRACVLLDSDEAGAAARRKVEALAAQEREGRKGRRLPVLLLGEAAEVKKTEVAIEDLFPDDFYRDCVNQTFGLAIRSEDLPRYGSDSVTARIAHVLKTRHRHSGLDRAQVTQELLKRFDAWSKARDLPGETAKRATRLFKAINSAFARAG